MDAAIPYHLKPAVERFIALIDGWCMELNKRVHWPVGPLLLLLAARLRDTKDQVLRIVALVDAGKWRERVPRKPAAAKRPADHPSRQPRKSRFDIRLGWMCKLVPYVIGGYGEAIYALLIDPEMVAYMNKAPRIGDLMRPLLYGTGYSPKPGQLYPVPPSARVRRRQRLAAAAEEQRQADCAAAIPAPTEIVSAETVPPETVSAETVPPETVSAEAAPGGPAPVATSSPSSPLSPGRPHPLRTRPPDAAAPVETSKA